MRTRIFFLIIISMILENHVNGQQAVTVEDSLHRSKSKISSTFIGGYGDVSYQHDFNLKSSVVNLNRAVLFVGHRFNDRISFFSELEIEDAKIEGGEPGGEVALEQVYIKFNLNKNNYITAGLFIPRIGMINENHLPADFNGTERPFVEKYIIPSTWREIGIGWYGNLNRIPVSYSLAICNGLNSAAFEHGTGIRNGRFVGSQATANNMAVAASLQYYTGNIRVQVSGYSGGSVGLAPKQADSLKLKSGLFGTPVSLAEANIKYEYKGIVAKVLGTIISIPDAGDINRAYASNTPELLYGAYIEAAYNIFESVKQIRHQKLFLFARYEKLDLNDRIPANGIIDKTLKQDHIIAGLTYMPVSNVVIKADMRFLKTGEENEALVINPSPVAPPYETNSSFLNIGLGYAF